MEKKELCVGSKLLGSVCSICQCEYRVGEKYVTLCCGHNYHACCLRDWLIYGENCPLCRENLLEGSVNCVCSDPSSPPPPPPPSPPPSPSPSPSPSPQSTSTSTSTCPGRSPRTGPSRADRDLSASLLADTDGVRSSSLVRSVTPSVSQSTLSVEVSRLTPYAYSGSVEGPTLSTEDPDVTGGLVYEGLLRSNVLSGSPPVEPANGIEIRIILPNNVNYCRRFNQNDRVGDLLNYIRQIGEENDMKINQLNLQNRNGERCDYNSSLGDVGLEDGIELSLQ